ncbi:MAG: phage holin family protein [Ruminococcus sp.]|nr:phage holin family protein [Ruminococcus sp.]
MNLNHIKFGFAALLGFLSSLLGVLALPVSLVVACNIIDYASGLMASPYREQDINSYKSIRGICKKVCMWLLIVVGAIIDQTLLYASDIVGITLPFTFLVACIVALWIICNEIISILENVKDMGVSIPGFLEPLVKNIKSQVEEMGEQQEGNIEKKHREGE